MNIPELLEELMKMKIGGFGCGVCAVVRLPRRAGPLQRTVGDVRLRRSERQSGSTLGIGHHARARGAQIYRA